MDHKEWVENEYKLWAEALNESTVHNFKEHPMVRRMLGDINFKFPIITPLSQESIDLLIKIDSIGFSIPTFTGVAARMVYYAQKVMLAEPISIIEIGAGVGEFYAILKALGYQGYYEIMDLPEVEEFQFKYLREVSAQTGLSLPLGSAYELQEKFVVSFYALGEFENETKAWYIENVVKKAEHGLIIWNPHSGASSQVPFECTITDEDPLTHPGNKQLVW